MKELSFLFLKPIIAELKDKIIFALMYSVMKIIMQFMRSSLDSLFKDLPNSDFKYFSQKFSGDLLKLVKRKGVYPYEYMDSFVKFSENILPDR